MAKSPLEKLSALTNPGAQSAQPKEQSEDEARFTADMEKILALAADLTEGDMFDAQGLIMACAEELRIQIRQEYEEED